MDQMDQMDQMEQMEQNEQEFGPRLGRMLDAYTDGLPTPGTDLVGGGLARGRRLRRRRRTVWGAAAFTVATGLTGGAVLAGILPAGAGSGSGTHHQAAGPATVTIPDFSLAAARTTAPDGKVAVTGKATLATLRDLLPGKPTTGGYEGWQSKESPVAVSAGGRLLISVGEGRAETTVSLQSSFQLTAFDALSKEAAREAATGSGTSDQDKSGRPAPDKSAAAKQAPGPNKKLLPATKAQLQAFYSCADRPETGTTLSSCTARNLDDGSVLLSYEEKSGSLLRRTADLLRTDGTRIVVTTSNARDSKRGPADISSPPLTLVQLAGIVDSPTWQAWVEPSVNEQAKGIS
ncbi:hypothetical protein [Streptomyces cellulosae]|uniref:hypothetical protein n=1 Tax=Streptomyces cellulosae TaxID=1968 RepID=UPI0004C64451|nr:hypothetical protein [Streptomyces cellulosae]